jgi:hypothetical protein
MLYQDGDYDLSDHMGGMALGGRNVNVGRQSQERAAARRGITLAQYLKESGKKKAKLVKKAPKKAPAKRGRPAKEPLAVRKAQANKYDVYDVRKRLFAKDAKHPLRAYDNKQQKKLNRDLVKLGSGAHMRQHQCPHCGGAWYDDVWDVVKKVAPVVAPFLL